ncbi:Trypsin Inhibitor-like, cysteine rich domain-containing protein, partial [Strongyloides ratti]
PTCPANMVYSTCTSSCPPKCSVENGKPQDCVYKCNAPGCECQAPFALNEKGDCVPREECSSTPTCPANMVYSTCTSSCPPRCSIDNGKPQDCVYKCNAPGCECLPPFALDDDNNCVPVEECLTNITSTTNITLPNRRGYIFRYIKRTVQKLISIIFLR